MKLHLKNITQTGLSTEDWQEVLDTCSNFTNIEEIILFGSRAMGNHSKNSDIDLAIVGKKFTHLDMLRLSGLLNDESTLPYFFDIVVLADVTNDELRRHIKEVGITVLQKAN